MKKKISRLVQAPQCQYLLVTPKPTTTFLIAWYSASAEYLDTTLCFFDFQEIKESPSLTKYPETNIPDFEHVP